MNVYLVGERNRIISSDNAFGTCGAFHELKQNEGAPISLNRQVFYQYRTKGLNCNSVFFKRNTENHYSITYQLNQIILQHTFTLYAQNYMKETRNTVKNIKKTHEIL